MSPTLYALTLTTINTEYSQAIIANARKLAFRCRSQSDIRYAFVTGKVATPTDPYSTLRSNTEYWIDFIKMAALTVYFASATAGVIVEIEAWA